MNIRCVAAISAVIFSMHVVTAGSAPHHGPKNNGYRIGTVVTAKRQELRSNLAGYTATDAPLQPDAYAYDVSVQMDCGIYIGRYESPFDSLNAVFEPNRQVRVRLEKHVMYVEIVGEYSEYRMAIIKRSQAATTACDKSGDAGSKTIH